jgi:hypothetical protein
VRTIGRDDDRERVGEGAVGPDRARAHDDGDDDERPEHQSADPAVSMHLVSLTPLARRI